MSAGPFRRGDLAEALSGIVVSLCQERLAAKDTPYRAVIAASVPARAGASVPTRLRAANAPAALDRYLTAAASAPPGDLAALAAAAARAQDTVEAVAIEDGAAGLAASLPPPERRGLVAIAPPFVHADAMFFLAEAAKTACERWPTGTFVFRRPLNDLWAAERFDVGLAEWLLTVRGLAPEKLLRADLWSRDPEGEGPAPGAGVLVVNPPYQLDEKLLALLPWLAETLADDASAGWRLDGAFTPDSLTTEEF